MRKSFWMIHALLLFTALGGAVAHADSLVISGGNVTGIDDITVGTATYDVTFGTAEDTTFASDPSSADTLATDILIDLYPTYTDVSDSDSNDILYIGVDAGTDAYVASLPGDFIGSQLGSTYLTNVGIEPDVLSYAELTVVSSPESGSSTLTLTGLGLLGLLAVMRKRVARRRPQAT
jgi:hypothetical protein